MMAIDQPDVILIGGISRRDSRSTCCRTFSQPTVNVRVTYTGVRWSSKWRT